MRQLLSYVYLSKSCLSKIKSHRLIVNYQTYNYYSTNNDRKEKIRIGCASGFWGDTPTAVGQLVKLGKLDYLVMDYLSEVTMSLLVKSKQKNPEMGWCPDFAGVLAPLLPQIKKQGIKIVTNAGGVNTTSCMAAIVNLAKNSNIDLKVAMVTGDDLLAHSKESLSKEQCPNPSAITSANAYFGAGPIARALDFADIVITGRCTDSALALGPLVHSFKWDWNNFDLMAAGSLAGHLIECGAQATGGIFTDWEEVYGWEYNGFPIAECSSNGDFLITKPDKTGGVVNRGTVSEQLLYEIDNPKAYILPDVVCDFTHVSLTETENGVQVKGAKGLPPTPYYKIGGTWLDGYKSTAVCPIIGPKSREKAHKVAQAILSRMSGIFNHFKLPDFKNSYVQVLGTEEAYGQNARKENLESRDAVLWLSVHHQDKNALEMFAREIASAGTGMAPGLTTAIGGRPKPAPLLRFFSYLHPKSQMPIKITCSDGYEETYSPPQTQIKELIVRDECEEEVKNCTNNGTFSYKLSQLAWLRSGDKGNNCNIGVIARSPAYYDTIKKILTSKEVEKYFIHKWTQSNYTPSCTRYEVPGIYGLNFVLKDSLGGGGIGALNPDPQGKGFAQMLADFNIENVPKLL